MDMSLNSMEWAESTCHTYRSSPTCPPTNIVHPENSSPDREVAYTNLQAAQYNQRRSSRQSGRAEAELRVNNHMSDSKQVVTYTI